MKNLKKIMKIAVLPAALLVASCGQKDGNASKAYNSGSESQTTPNDSSGAESNKAMGVGEDNQKSVSGYPSNQSNLNSDSTSKRHDTDTTRKKPAKDKPNRTERNREQ
jgi:hypothetical protein